MKTNKKRTKRRTTITIILIIILIILTQQATKEKENHMTLLTVATNGNQSIGGTADLYLKIRPGTGNVYIATYPITKVDTQISTRFAKEVACKITETDCNEYDFFYTIRADSPIIGGPSAGAAIATITAATLKDWPVNEKTTITGTISSGGLIGPVAGIKEKIKAAKIAGITTIVIPKWEAIENKKEHEKEHNESQNKTTNNNTINETIKEIETINKIINETINNTPINITEEGITIIRAETIEEAIKAVTGVTIKEPENLTIPKEYENTMKAVAENLCERSKILLKTIEEKELQRKKDNEELMNISKKFLEEANKTTDKPYSRASFCFSANLRLREIITKNMTAEKRNEQAEEIKKIIKKEKERIKAIKLETITDLQTTEIVLERLEEAEEQINGKENISARELATAIERLYSAAAWSNFFKLPGEKMTIDQKHLKESCEEKISEAEERRGYLETIFKGILEIDTSELNKAYEHHQKGEYLRCLFKATKAKATMESIISGTYTEEKQIQELIEQKRKRAKINIARESEKGRFPILAYSYYEYAGSLKEQDPYSAIIFSSYSLELADLSSYFPKKKGITKIIEKTIQDRFILGFLIGGLVMIILLGEDNEKTNQKKTKKRTKKETKNNERKKAKQSKKP